MKISTYIHLAITIVGACFVQACSSDENKIATQQGYLSLSTNIDGSIAMSDGSTLNLPDNQLPETADLALTLSTADGQYSHTWQSFDNFPLNESYQAGEYDVQISSEAKNGGPKFSGEQILYVQAGERTEALIDCRPSEALILFSVSQGNSPYTLNNITVHTDGGGYVDAPTDGYTYFDAGDAQLYAQLTDDQQRTLRLAMPYTATLAAAHGERVAVSLNGSDLKFNNTSYTINKSIFSVSAPTITPVGFSQGTTVDVNEGITLQNAVKMLASAGREIVSAKFTVQSPILKTVDAPSEIDLMKLSSTEHTYLEQVGFKFTVASDKKSIYVDLSSLLENMASYTSAVSRFTLMVEDAAGVCSDALTLTVNTKVLTLQPESISAAVIGVNKATMQISAGGSVLEQQDVNIYSIDSNGNRSECQITGWRTVGSNVEVEFTVPEGNADVDIDVYYLGLKRFSAVVKRAIPTFSLEVDAYATNAAVKVVAQSDDVAQAVIKYGTFTVNDSPVIVSTDYSDSDVALIQNLQPQKQYTVGVSMAGSASSYYRFTTEADTQVPEGDFEDWDPLFKYENLPMGGRYSSTDLAIVNRQNYTNIDVQWPKKYWASINDKTFNKQSTHHNTWYMQPSSVIVYEPQSGSKAICITSVGWDHNGEKIADYVQKQGESLPYSQVVPKVSHRSAGRLFLGSYSYNFATGTETFNEGYSFTSRPSSLNGFYMYTTDDTYRTDKGYVQIEIINETNGVETVIASGRAEFSATTDYKAFNVPLTYKYYNVKATRLKIMFASTTHTGTQAYEDANVPLTAHPDKGVMRGSSLWIDNLSFTY